MFDLQLAQVELVKVLLVLVYLIWTIDLILCLMVIHF